MDEPIDEEWWPPHTQRSERHCPICLQLECVCEEIGEEPHTTDSTENEEPKSTNHWNGRKDLE